MTTKSGVGGQEHISLAVLGQEHVTIADPTLSTVLF